MYKKSKIYIFFLTLMIASFFIFTGGITDSTYSFAAPSLSSFAIGTSSPIIYNKLPFSIIAINNHYKHNCDDEYYTARDLIGSLKITQGATVVDTSNFVFVSETGGDKTGYTGSFVDSVVMNNAGTYTATATFYDSQDPDKKKSTMTLQFTVSLGSEIPLSAGTYQLSTFTAACASSTRSPYTYANTSASNTLVIHPDGLTALLNINIQMGSNVLTQYPCLGDTSYNYNANGNFSVVKENGAKYLKIEYENSAYVNFNYSFDGTNLGLNYSKNGSNYVLNFVKQ